MFIQPQNTSHIYRETRSLTEKFLQDFHQKEKRKTPIYYLRLWFWCQCWSLAPPAGQSLEHWMRFLLISATFLQPGSEEYEHVNTWRREHVNMWTWFTRTRTRTVSEQLSSPDSAMDRRNSSWRICSTSLKPSSPWNVTRAPQRAPQRHTHNVTHTMSHTQCHTGPTTSHTQCHTHNVTRAPQCHTHNVTRAPQCHTHNVTRAPQCHTHNVTRAPQRHTGPTTSHTQPHTGPTTSHTQPHIHNLTHTSHGPHNVIHTMSHPRPTMRDSVQPETTSIPLTHTLTQTHSLMHTHWHTHTHAHTLTLLLQSTANQCWCYFVDDFQR